MAYDEMTREKLIETLCDRDGEIEDLEGDVEDLEHQVKVLEQQNVELETAEWIMNERECIRCGRLCYVDGSGFCSSLCRDGFRVDPRVFPEAAARVNGGG